MRTIAAAVVALLGGLWWLLPTAARHQAANGDRQVHTADTTPQPLRLPPSAGPARQPLKDLAARTAALADTPGPGRYTYVHLQSWSRENAPAGSDVKPQIMIRDEKLWWDTEHSARMVVTLLAALPPMDAAVAAAGPPTVVDESVTVVIEDPSADASLLSGQFNDHEPLRNGPQASVRAVASLYRYHTLSASQRAAALTVLADDDGLRLHSPVTGRAGRTAPVRASHRNGDIP